MGSPAVREVVASLSRDQVRELDRRANFPVDRTTRNAIMLVDSFKYAHRILFRIETLEEVLPPR